MPAYLLLAEGNIGLGRLKAAEEYLLYANWAVLQSAAACPSSTHSLLRRHFGNLYVRQGRLDAALSSYALDVYHASREFGPEHIETSNGIFLMGCTFMLTATAAPSSSASSSSQPKQPPPPARAVESCLAFFDKYVDIWYKFLLHLRARQEESIADYLHDHQLATATASLLHIVRTRSSRLGRRHIATAEAVYVLGLLKLMGGADVDADWLLSRAEAVYSEVLGADNESTVGIRRAREEMSEVRMQRGERMQDWEEEEEGTANEKETVDVAALTPLKAQQEEKQQMAVAAVDDARHSRASSTAAAQSSADRLSAEAQAAQQQQRDEEREEHKEELQPSQAEDAEPAGDGAAVVPAAFVELGDSPSETAEVKNEEEESDNIVAAAPDAAETVPAAVPDSQDVGSDEQGSATQPPADGAVKAETESENVTSGDSGAAPATDAAAASVAVADEETAAVTIAAEGGQDESSTSLLAAEAQDSVPAAVEAAKETDAPAQDEEPEGEATAADDAEPAAAASAEDTAAVEAVAAEAAEAEDEQRQESAGDVSHRSTSSESQSQSAVSLSSIQPAAAED